MDNIEKRNIILDNYKDNSKRKDVDDESYIKLNSRNVSCIDNINLYLKINNNIIKDIKFNGEACVIATSSTVILINNLINKNISDALNIISNYEKMVEGLQYDATVLNDLLVFDDINKQPSRKICATLASRKIRELLENPCK